ncbi:MAG: hypothetical protein ACLRL4_06550 [Bifidobacterium bifidum]
MPASEAGLELVDRHLERVRHSSGRAERQTLGPVWGWTWADPAATTINAVALTIGVVIGASTLKAKASKA